MKNISGIPFGDYMINIDGFRWNDTFLLRVRHIHFFIFQFPLITFEDQIEFSFNVTLDPSGYFVPGTMDIYTLVPVDVTYKSLQRPDRADTTTHYFPEPFIIEFMFDVPGGFTSNLICF